MTPLLAALLLTPAAPVPKPKPPPPFAYAYLGVRMSVSDNTLTIEQPEPHTPAFKAGLRDGDRIVQLGRIRPTSFEQLSDYIIDLRPGTDIYVEVRRNDEIVATRLVLGVRPDTPDYDPAPIFRRRMGLPPPDDR
jgi:predicted metalloprotease with PDZ domain